MLFCSNKAEFSLRFGPVQGKSLAIIALEIILAFLNRDCMFLFYEGLLPKKYIGSQTCPERCRRTAVHVTLPGHQNSQAEVIAPRLGFLFNLFYQLSILAAQFWSGLATFDVVASQFGNEGLSPSLPAVSSRTQDEVNSGQLVARR